MREPRFDESKGRSSSYRSHVEPLSADRCRVISRYRCACSEDLATRLQYGEFLMEPIGYAMDRRMLRGIKQRAERHQIGSGPGLASR